MPGGVVCSVITCKNNSNKSKREGKFLRFFNFPKDPELSARWMVICGAKPSAVGAVSAHKRVCSEHFAPDDFEDNLKLLGTRARKLKKDAVPSQCLSLMQNSTCTHTKAAPITLQKRRNVIKQVVHNNTMDNGKATTEFDKAPKVTSNLVSTKAIPNLEYCLAEINTEDKKEDSQIPCKKKVEIKDGNSIIQMLQNENNILKQKIADLKNNDNINRQKIDRFKRILAVVAKRDRDEFEDRVKVAFKDLFSPKQVEMVLRKKARSRWSDKEMTQAFRLRSYGRRSYAYLQETLKFPLPSLPLLRQWAAEVHIRQSNPYELKESRKNSSRSL